MDHSAQKSPDSVPPFKGFVRVVVGETYPPGLYFGPDDASANYTTTCGRGRNVGFNRMALNKDGWRIYYENLRNIVNEVNGAVWFQQFVPLTTPAIIVKNGDTIEPGELEGFGSAIDCRLPIVLDYGEEVESVAIGVGDRHVVERPARVCLVDMGNALTIKWRAL